MHRHDEPNCSGEDCLREVTRILAAGVLRLHARAALTADSTEQFGAKNLPENRQDSLEVRRGTVLSVTTGVDGSRDPETRR